MIDVKIPDEVKMVFDHVASKKLSCNSMLVRKAVVELTTTRSIDWRKEEISEKEPFHNMSALWNKKAANI